MNNCDQFEIDAAVSVRRFKEEKTGIKTIVGNSQKKSDQLRCNV